MLKIFSRNTDQLSDQDLVERFTKTRKMRFLGDLYGRYMEMQFGLCFKYLKDRQKAEDAVMSVFEELIEKLPKHRVSNFRSWLYVLTKNYCLMILRDSQKKLESPISHEENMHFEDFLHHTDEELKEEEFNQLEDCINHLPKFQKECIKYHYYEKKSYKEIAQLMGKENKKIRSYIQNGRRNLKNCMTKKSEELT